MPRIRGHRNFQSSVAFLAKKEKQAMTPTWFVVPAAAVVLGIAGLSPTPSYAAEPGFAGQQYGWDVPPQEYNNVQRRGFHDGVEGAQKDYGNARRPDVNNREEYRDPNDMPRDIPPPLRNAYRDAFRRGYEVAASHLWNAAPPQQQGGYPQQYYPQQPPASAYPPPPPQQNWEWGMRGLQSDAQRQGYREGVEEARKDFQFNRRRDPDDHEEYREPYVAPQFVDEYREGFMRGYTVAMSQLSGDPSWQQYTGSPEQWQAPRAYSEMQQRGFRDGVDGARKDYGNSRRPDPNNRDEYRHPLVPDQFRFEYRQGFRRGYEMAAARLWGGM